MKPQCIDAVNQAVGRKLSEAELKSVEDRISRHMRQLARDKAEEWRGMSPADRLTEAARSASDELRAEAAKKAERTALQITATARAIEKMGREREVGKSGAGSVVSILEQVDLYAKGVQHENFSALMDALHAAEPRFFGWLENPAAVRDFSAAHPHVALHLHQGTPRQVAELLLSGEADIGVATEALADYSELLALPCYRWTHKVIVPKGHALAAEAAAGDELTLQRLADFPIITYEPGYTGRRHIDDAFKQQGLEVNLVLSAMDADVIKTYVELGMGVGIIAAMAYDEERDLKLSAIEARHLFATNMTRIGLRRGNFLRSYVYDFIQSFAPPLTPDAVRLAMASGVVD
jgi:DNA-binding transcriptional LysR family regulator